jgi:prevent-host-death family protein
MPKSISASEAKTRFGAIVEWALESNDDVIVESHGKPRVVIMSFTEYQKVLNLREMAQRREALAELECLRESVRARNPDLDEAGAAALADRFSRDVIEDMVRDKKVTFRP